MAKAPPQLSNQAGRLANLDEDGKAPKSRLSTADSARSMLANMINGDNVASLNRTRVQNMIDLAPPVSDDDLKKANIDWYPRVNWGGARGKISDYLTAYNDLLNTTDSIANITLTEGPIDQREDWAQTLSEEYHDVLFQSTDQWSFLYHMELHHRMLAIHGVGPCYWPDEKDWRFRALKRRNILVPRESPSEAARLPIVFIRDAMYVDEVFAHISNSGGKQVEKSKWNYEACVVAIKHAQKRDKDKFSFESMQEKWKNNAWDWSYNESDMVLIAHAFVKEFDGRVSHHILTENGYESYKPEAPDNGYIFSKIGAYDSMTQAVWVCFQDVGNGDFESVRGYGTYAYFFGEAQNKLNNSLVANAMMGSTPMVKCDTEEHAKRLTRTQIGMFHVFPPGVEFMQNQMGASVQGTLAVSQHFSQLEAQTNGGYRTTATTPQNQARTATEVQAEIGETSKLSNSNVSHYLNQGDLLLGETFRRLTRKTILPKDGGGTIALQFRDNCIARGIPEKLFYQLCKTAVVTFSRPVGNGSYADRISRLARIGQFIGDMPQRKRARYVRDCIAQIGGARELADKYGPDLEQQFPGIEQSIAILENNGFQAGGMQDPFSPDNDHLLHLQTHMPFAQQTLQGQEPPEQIAAVMDVLYNHMAEHVQALENDPTRVAAFKQYESALGEMANAVKQVKKMAQLAQQPQPQQSDPAVIKAQGQVQIQDKVAQAEIQRKDAVAKQHLALNDAKTSQELEHKRLQTEQELLHNAALTQQELRSQKLTDEQMLKNKSKNGK